ncbi:MAG: 6-bladed beta-propeller [Candidatus Aminicenantes bacterium]|nr:6-bladed beta-propeller [Candidatus Aminicenantes bacterium]
MKNSKCLFLLLILLTASFISLEANKKHSLRELYRAGKIRLIPALALDESSMPKEALFGVPVNVVEDSNGNIYVSDFKMHNIEKFDSLGRFSRLLGRMGQGPGEFNGPTLMTLAKNRLVVWEMGNSRLSSLTLDGVFLKSIITPVTEGWPKKIRSLPNGDIVIDRFKSIRRPEYHEICSIELYSPELEHKKTIYSKNVTLKKYITEPKRASILVPFPPNVHWDVSKDGKIVIGFSDKYLVEIYDSNGEKINSFTHKRRPMKISKQSKRLFINRYVQSDSDGTRMEPPDYIVKNTIFPRYMPAFHGISVDSENNILIGIYHKDGSILPNKFDAFNTEGNYIGTVEVTVDRPIVGYAPACFVGSYVWIPFEDDEEGTVEVVKYKISR